MTLRLASNNADEQLRRRRESVTRLRSLARRDPEMWAEPYGDALLRLAEAEAKFFVKPSPETPEPSPETHVIVGDHSPEQRRA